MVRFGKFFNHFLFILCCIFYCSLSLFLSLQAAGLKHGDMFEELPVALRQSNLVNGLLHSLAPDDPPYDLLHLSAT